jgi:hypothetical protein
MKRSNLTLILLVALVVVAVAIIVIAGGPRSEIVSRSVTIPGESVRLDWHSVNPPRPGLTCWAAEISESFGYLGYGYSYIYCEPSS